MSATELTPEQRVERAEAALEASLAERNLLWAELQSRRARERELTELRERLAAIEGSDWWRAGKPLRLAQRAAREPRLAAKILRGYVRILRARLGL